MGSEMLFNESLSESKDFFIPFANWGSFLRPEDFFCLKGPGVSCCLSNWQISPWCKPVKNICSLTSVWDSYRNIKDRVVYRNIVMYYIVTYHMLVSKYTYKHA